MKNNIKENINNPTLIKSLSNKNIEKIICGGWHSFAITSILKIKILENGDVDVFGFNFDGQLGNGNNNTLWTPTFINNIKNPKKLIAGYNHTIILNSKIFQLKKMISYMALERTVLEN